MQFQMRCIIMMKLITNKINKMETSKELKTPTQHMMIWVLQNFEKELENDIDKDKSLDEIFDETLTFEQRKMKEFFVAGIFKGKQNIDFDLDEEFKKFYSKLFPEE
jgi:hypothetical protein